MNLCSILKYFIIIIIEFTMNLTMDEIIFNIKMYINYKSKSIIKIALNNFAFFQNANSFELIHYTIKIELL